MKVNPNKTPVEVIKVIVWINEIDPYGCFQWYFRCWLGRRSKDDKRQTNR